MINPKTAKFHLKQADVWGSLGSFFSAYNRVTSNGPLPLGQWMLLVLERDDPAFSQEELLGMIEELNQWKETGPKRDAELVVAARKLETSLEQALMVVL